ILIYDEKIYLATLPYCVLDSVASLILIIFGWKFSNYSKEVKWHLSSIEKSRAQLLEGMVIQVKILKRIEDLEKNKSRANNGNLDKSLPKSKLQNKEEARATK
ncbi:MAG: hypothetical protein WBJ81_04410, partial [Rickettsiales bacterium]